MPPSLYLRTLSAVLSVRSRQRPLTLTLSPGRGDRFVDTGNKFEVRALRA